MRGASCHPERTADSSRFSKHIFCLRNVLQAASRTRFSGNARTRLHGMDRWEDRDGDDLGDDGDDLGPSARKRKGLPGPRSVSRQGLSGFVTSKAPAPAPAATTTPASEATLVMPSKQARHIQHTPPVHCQSIHPIFILQMAAVPCKQCRSFIGILPGGPHPDVVGSWRETQSPNDDYR